MDGSLTPDEEIALEQITEQLRDDISTAMDNAMLAVLNLPDPGKRLTIQIAIGSAIAVGVAGTIFRRSPRITASLAISTALITAAINTVHEKKLTTGLRETFDDLIEELREQGKTDAAVTLSFAALREAPHAFQNIASDDALKTAYVEAAESGNRAAIAYATADLKRRFINDSSEVTTRGSVDINMVQDLFREAQYRAARKEHDTALGLCFIITRGARDSHVSTIRAAQKLCQKLDPRNDLLKVFDEAMTKYPVQFSCSRNNLGPGR